MFDLAALDTAWLYSTSQEDTRMKKEPSAKDYYDIVKQNIHEGQAKLSACVGACPVNPGQKSCLAIRSAKYGLCVF